MAHYPSGNMEADIQYQRRWEFSGNFIEYEGIAPPNVGETDSGWIVKKYSNDGTNTTKVVFANNSNNFTLKWSDRTLYSYI